MAGGDPWGAFPDAPTGQAKPAAAPTADPWADFPDQPSPTRKTTPRTASVPGPIGTPTGEVHDGDTFRLSGGSNGRLYGVDAFELKQTGRTRAGEVLPVGEQARALLAKIALPQAVVAATGKQTYGRPVVTLDNNGDAGDALLRQGYGVATPEYLKADPERFGNYMEAEREARLNRRGAWAGSFTPPSNYRHNTPNPWDTSSPTKPGETQAVFWDEPLPGTGPAARDC